MPAPTPPLIPEAFATSGLRAVIPDTGAATGRADYSDGFPAITMQPKISGGLPPDGRDMNGILYALSAHLFALQGGQPYTYSSAASTAMGGYAVGAIVESTDGSNLWLNLISGNTTDPDAGGAGWVPFGAYGVTTISSLTGGTRTLSASEAKYGTIVISGTLVANLSLVFPTTLSEWRIINNCTGAYTVTARTSGGTGVTIPAGGASASTSVFGDGTNIYLSVPPVVLPIDVNPTANTLLMRNNSGDGFVRYLNGSNSPEAFAISTVLATNGSDGYFRKISIANFLLQVFFDAVLTGNPTAPTPPVGDNDISVSTTRFLQQNTVGGADQSWRNLTGSRAFNTTYTNTTGRPIQVMISITIDVGSGGSNSAFLINGSPMCYLQGDVVHQGPSLSAIIPAGATYRLNAGVNAGISAWSELR